MNRTATAGCRWERSSSWQSRVLTASAGRTAMRLTGCPALSYSVCDHVRLIVRARLVNREICRCRRSRAQRRRGRGWAGRRRLDRHTSIYCRLRVDAGPQVFHYPRRLFITRTASAKSLYNRTSRPLCDTVGLAHIVQCDTSSDSNSIEAARSGCVVSPDRAKFRVAPCGAQVDIHFLEVVYETRRMYLSTFIDVGPAVSES